MLLTTLLMLAPLTVIVEDVRSEEGQIYVSVQDSGDYMQQRGAAGSITAPELGTMQFDYDVNPGVYAVSIWHDEDNNQQFDQDERGMPLDGWALSGNGGYLFDDAKVSVEENGAIVRVRMTYPE